MPPKFDLDYSVIFNATVNAMAFTEYDTGRIVDVNAAWVKAAGIPREQTIGKTALELGIWRNAAQLDQCLAELNQIGRIVDFEIRLIMRSRELTYLATASIVKLNAGRHILWEFRDISERKQTEEVLGLMRISADAATDAYFWITQDARIVEVNPAACRSLGYSRYELLQLGIADIDTQISDERWPQHFAELRRLGSHTFESIHRAKDGRLYPVEIVCNYVQFRGREYGCAFARDISERKLAQASLHESESQLRLALQAAQMGTFTWDILNNRVMWTSHLHERRYGDPADFEATDDGIFQHIHTDDLPAINNALAHCMETRAPFAREFRVNAPDGSLLWVLCVGQFDFDTLGRATIMHGVSLDITARKRIESENALLEAQLRESQKMEAIGTLAGGIAHDFNNIIATILGNTELALKDVGANPRAAQESVDEIRKAALRAREVVQQILSFSRRQPTERKLIVLGPVVDEAVRLLRATLPARIVLEVDSAADLPPVWADAVQIQQIILNLVTNAMQAMQGKPGRIDIILDTMLLNEAMASVQPELRSLYERHHGPTVFLKVSDTAGGMDPAIRDKIFEPFFTTKPRGEGTGLGLSVVFGIVQTHEGAIWVDSDLGRGTTVTIHLPAARQQATIAATENVRSAATRLNIDKHILYLDDDEALVFLVKRLLERRGIRVSGYSSQSEALAAVTANPDLFDLVVTDYNMPGMSGVDITHAVRLIRADLPVVVTSGFIDETLQAQAHAAGVRELVFKATAVEDLCEEFARLA